MPTPEALARQQIDAQLASAGWSVQDHSALNLWAGRGVAVREYPLPGHGFADYLLFVDRKAVGVVEAKSAGTTLTGVELQTARYGAGLPASMQAPVRPLPFLYQSTGVETRFTNRLDPEPRSREVFSFHRPETMADWLAAEPLWLPVRRGEPQLVTERPATLRGRLTTMPPVPEQGLWPAQLTAVRNLEQSLAEDRPRALVQMATGSGKTYTAVTSIYRLVKHAGARRVLFLVDRGNLGRQALKEFQQYVTPDDGRKFTELYNVQHLTSNRLDPVARVTIGTIQRLYSMLQGKELAEEDDETSLDGLASLHREPVPVTYDAAIPPETFDVVFVDECHRSIYTVWKQVLDYFDAHLVGLTATPSKQTFGFFNKNLVMEYGHEAAVADGVNVDFDLYRIRTRITERGSTVDAGTFVDRRDRETRQRRWEKLDEDLAYDAGRLDRDVVALDQIRTVVRTYRDRLFTEIFPGRTEVPKTLIFAKDDSHAEDVVQIVREEFGRGNEFAQKITYRSTGVSPEQLISDFRTGYYPRIAVTVDMIATGTDVKPLEVVMFLRSVRSRNLFEQMKGRGVRVIDPTDFRGVTPDARAKTHFVIVDCVGVCEQELSDTRPLDREPSVPLAKLLQAVAVGNTSEDVVSSLAGRLARLDRQLAPPERASLAELAGGASLGMIVRGLLDALDPDRQLGAALAAGSRPAGAVPDERELLAARSALLEQAAMPLAANPALRQRIVDLRRSHDQVIDATSADELIEAGASPATRDRARELTRRFETFVSENRDEITALSVLYAQPHRRRLTRAEVKELARAIEAPPRAWTTDQLWHAYEALDASRVRGTPARVLTNVVSLVRYAMHQDDALVPFEETARARFAAWLAQQEQRGRRFTSEQLAWLERIRDHVAANLEIAPEDFDDVPFAQHGGLGAAHRVFGAELPRVLEEVVAVVAA